MFLNFYKFLNFAKFTKFNNFKFHKTLNVYILFCMFSLFSFLIIGCAGDSPISSSSEQIYLNKIVRLGNLTFACGTNGTYYYKNESSWKKVNLDTQQPLLDLYFYDNNLGFITTEKGIIFKTTNSGLDWKKIQIQSNQSYSSISFIDINIGWVAGTNGKIFKTIDGGINWVDTSFVDEVFWETIKINKDGSGYVAGSLDNSYNTAILYITNDFGENWTEVDLSNYEMKGITKVRETNFGYLLISSSKVIFTPFEKNKRFIEFTEIFDINSLSGNTFFISDLMFTDRDNNSTDNLSNNFVVIGYRGHNLGNILINNNFTFTNNSLNYYLLDGITDILDNNKEFSIDELLFVGGYGNKVFNISGDVIELK